MAQDRVQSAGRSPEAPSREMLYGRHAVEEAVKAGRRRIYRILIAEGVKLQRSDLQKDADERGMPIVSVSRQQLDRLGPVNHQGVAAEAAAYPYYEPDDLLEEQIGVAPPIILILDSLQDPQNFGALIRTAEAIGVSGVLLPRHRSVGVTPAVVNASAGAVEHVRVALATNLVSAMEKLKAAGYWIVGLEDAPDAQRYDQADLRSPLGIVVGSEGQGLGRLVRQNCDFRVRLPMQGRIESLNASIAGSIVLYEAWRQRHSGASPTPIGR